MRLTLNILIIICSVTFGYSQEGIFIKNKSFEGPPGSSAVPEHWVDGGFRNTSPPDTQPGFGTLEKLASDGKTYLGLITRETGSWECVYQELISPIEPGRCYELSMDLSTYKNYSVFAVANTDTLWQRVKEKTISAPCRLRIWGSNLLSVREELLAESPIVKHEDWKTYKLQFSSNQPYKNLILEAYYDGTNFNYQGNILVDNLSDLKILESNCESEQHSPESFDELVHQIIQMKSKPYWHKSRNRGDGRIVSKSAIDQFGFTLFYELASKIKYNPDLKLIIGIRNNIKLYPSKAMFEESKIDALVLLKAFGLKDTDFELVKFKNKRNWIITNVLLGIRIGRKDHQ